MKLEGQAAYLLGKAVALLEDMYIGMRDPNIKLDYKHKMLLFGQEVNEYLNRAFGEENK